MRPIMANRKRAPHEWRSRDEDGETRIYRATLEAGQWLLASRLKNEEEWVAHDPPEESLLRDLRTILWNKYQRRKLPWETVNSLDKLLGDAE